MDFFKDLWNKVYDMVLGSWSKILTFLCVLLVGYVVIRLVVMLFRRVMNRSRLKGVAGNFLTSLIKVLLYVIYLIALLSLLGVPTTSLIALLSAFALAISLALQGTFSNVASGIFLVTTKPFEEGDFVDIGGMTGTVEAVSIFRTRLVTPDNKVVSLPNSTVADANITNYSAKETRRVDLALSVAYGTDVDAVKRVFLEVVQRHTDLILTKPEPVIRLNEHAASSLNFTARVWVKGSDYWTVYFMLMEEILPAFAQNGIEIPYNQLDVHVIPPQN